MSYSLITERRRHAPRGRDGGWDGQPGSNSVDGDEVPAKAAGAAPTQATSIRIETPGGGGFGAPSEDSAA